MKSVAASKRVHNLIQVEDPQSSDSDMDGVYECISKNQLFISTCTLLLRLFQVFLLMK